MNKYNFALKILCIAVIFVFSFSPMSWAICCSFDAIDGSIDYKKFKDKGMDTFRISLTGRIILDQNIKSHKLLQQARTCDQPLQSLFGFSTNDTNCIKSTAYRFT